MRLIAAFIVSASAVAAYGENRSMDNYRSIVDRNPFGLKPVPVKPEPAAPLSTNTPPKAEQFYLTGISTIGYPNRPKKAFLLNKDNSKKEYHEKFYTLQINEKQGDLQLDDIDEAGKRVKVTYQGNEMWLSMKDNGVPTPTSTAPPQSVVAGAAPAMGVGGLPGVPGMHPPGGGGGGMPLPGGVNTVAQPIAAPVSTSNRRLPRSSQFNQGGSYQGAGNPVYTPNVPANPVQNPYGSGSVGGQPIGQADIPIDPVIQAINMNAAKIQAERQGQDYPPIPQLTP